MIALACCDCGAPVGAFDPARLPLAVRAALGALGATFARDDGEGGAKLPILCVPCTEKPA